MPRHKKVSAPSRRGDISLDIPFYRTFPTSRDLDLSGRVLNRLGSYWKTEFSVRVVELDKLAAHFKTREIAEGLQKSPTSTKHGGRPQGEQIVRQLMTLEFLRQ